MTVAPIPVCFSIRVPEAVKLNVLAMALFDPHTICAVFMVIPFVIVVVSFVVVGPVLLRSQCRRYCDWQDENGTQ